MGRRKKSKRSQWSVRLRRAAVITAVVTLVAVLLVGGGLLFRNASSGGGPRAVIVDQLSLTFPNPAFVASATRTLEQAGYAVDYYPGEEVTVDLYRDLPRRGYDYVVLRVHSGLRVEADLTDTDELGLFTSEPYSRAKYIDPQVARHLGVGRMEEGGQPYLGIGPSFIQSVMRGSFDNATVILMGCEGLLFDRTAEAFLQRGAGTVVSWDRQVSAAHTDAATERLLEHMVLEGLMPQEAVARTAAEVGPDPVFGAELRVLAGEG